MVKLSLDGIYKLKRLEYGADMGPVFSENFFPAGYLDARVPGDVRTVLREQGYIDGYYLGKNLDKERWIEESDWLYVKDFYCGEELQGKENLLCFEGIDTLSEIWLNGVCVGKTRNMFIPYRFDVGEVLRYGGWNTLAVRIVSPVKGTENIDRTDIWPPEDSTRMVIRKSQMNWGWDFCGHCLTNGIWKSVYLQSRDRAAIGKLHLRTKEIREGEAVLEACWEVLPWESAAGGRGGLAAGRKTASVIKNSDGLEAGTGERSQTGDGNGSIGASGTDVVSKELTLKLTLTYGGAVAVEQTIPIRKATGGGAEDRVSAAAGLGGTEGNACGTTGSLASVPAGDRTEGCVSASVEDGTETAANGAEGCVTACDTGTVYNPERRAGGTFCGSTEIRVENPRLWWPRPYGEAALYEVSACLYEDGAEVDSRQFRFGIRTVNLNQGKLSEGGRRFLFEINGKPIFVRGANWVPLNCVYSEIRQEDYDFYFKRVLESNLSMLRVWGGGIYEPDLFFDFCDENGIMVFQDFMLACGLFPQDDGFLDQVSEEVETVVDRYYNRASLVLWSADNELDEAYEWAEQQERFRENRVNRVGVRRAVQKCDPYRPFLISSPCSPFEEEEGGNFPASPLQGDVHIYLTRFEKSSEYYYRKLLEFVPRFMSEYGFSSLPAEDSYYRFNFFGEKLDLQRNPWLGELSWLARMGEQGKESDLIYITQYTHAQALKYWIEYLRSAKWTCGGSLYWKFNDPVAPNRENMLFPSLMSAIDFMRRPKLAYYYARRAYEDIILAWREEEEGLAVYGCNETEQALPGTLVAEVLDYRGAVQGRWRKTAAIEADAATKMLLIPGEELEGFNRCETYVRAVFSSGEQRYENRFCLLEIGEFDRVKLPRAGLGVSVAYPGEVGYSGEGAHMDESRYPGEGAHMDEVKYSGEGAHMDEGRYPGEGAHKNQVQVTVETDFFAQDVTLTVQDTDVFYSDNMFHLDARGRKTVTLTFAGEGYAGKRLQVKAWNAEAVMVRL